MELPPLVFVYTGNPIPEYGLKNLGLCTRFQEQPVILITDQETTKVPSRIECVSPSGWYDKSPFDKLLQSSKINSSSHEGLWARALERFFILEQFMTHRSLQRLFHAELDNLVFDLSEVAEQLDRFGLGLFIPVDQSGRGFGSLIYCNAEGALRELFDYGLNHPDFKNEMELLGAYCGDSSTQGVLLPTASSITGTPIVATEAGPRASDVGIFDAAAIGQWLFGIDPNNTLKTTWNRWRNPASPDLQRGWRIRLRLNSWLAEIRPPGSRAYPVRNLHVHAKIHRRLTRTMALRGYLFASSLPFSIPIVIRWRAELGRLLKLVLRAREDSPQPPRIFSPITRPLIPILVKASRLPLSNRELRRLQGFLSASNSGRPQEDLAQPSESGSIESNPPKKLSDFLKFYQSDKDLVSPGPSKHISIVVSTSKLEPPLNAPRAVIGIVNPTVSVFVPSEQFDSQIFRQIFPEYSNLVEWSHGLERKELLTALGNLYGQFLMGRWPHRVKLVREPMRASANSLR